jgi:hypothetical protein
MKTFLILLLIFLITNSVYATNTWVSTFAELTTAISATSSGDIIYCNDGTYTWNTELTINKAITVTSTSGNRTNCTFDAAYGNRFFSTTPGLDGGAKFKSVRFYRGGGFAGTYYGFGIIGDATLEDCLIVAISTLTQDAFQNYYAGPYLNHINSKMIDCYIAFCGGDSAGGATIGNGLIKRCTFATNSVQGAAGALMMYGGKVDSCLFVGNTCGISYQGPWEYGGGAIKGSAGEVVNCTVISNYDNIGGVGGIYGGSISVTNSILYYNQGYDLYSTVVEDYNNIDVSNVSKGLHSIDQPPRFVDGMRLKQGSPCINTGTNYIYSLEDMDLDKNPIVWSAIQPTRDMGCYEYTRTFYEQNYNYGKNKLYFKNNLEY